MRNADKELASLLTTWADQSLAGTLLVEGMDLKLVGEISQITFRLRTLIPVKRLETDDEYRTRLISHCRGPLLGFGFGSYSVQGLSELEWDFLTVAIGSHLDKIGARVRIPRKEI